MLRKRSSTTHKSEKRESEEHNGHVIFVGALQLETGAVEGA